MARTSHLALLRTPQAAKHARELRRSLTRVERRLWTHLRAKRFHGWHIRRQVPIGRYVADFVCEKARVIVEVDGGQHSESVASDAQRTQWLESQGYRVLRYWNNEVLQNLEGVLETLLAALNKNAG